MTLHFLDIRACFIRWNKKWICRNLDLLMRSEEFATIHFGDAFQNQPDFMPGLSSQQEREPK
jgi:hypothetical protein